MILELTKRWRCLATANNVSAFNPEADCLGIGPTVFNDTICPYYYCTDEKEEMQTWIIQNEIIVDAENS